MSAIATRTAEDTITAYLVRAEHADLAYNNTRDIERAQRLTALVTRYAERATAVREKAGIGHVSECGRMERRIETYARALARDTRILIRNNGR